MNKRKVSTPRQVDSLRPEEREYLVDVDNGLKIRVLPSGTKIFQLRYTFDGFKRKISMGTYPEVTLAEAREKTLDIKRKISQGINPLEEREKQKAEIEENPSYELFVQYYYEERLLKDLKKPELAHSLLKRLPIDKRTRVQNITPQILKKALLQVSKKTPTTSIRMRSALMVAFDFAVFHDFIETNPLQSIKRAFIASPKNERDRILNPDEIRTFLELIDSAPFSRQVQLILKTMFFTGKRISEVCEAPKDEFNKNLDIWSIPKERSKTGVAERVPITETVKGFVRELFQLSGSSDYMCRSPQKLDKPIQYSSIDRAFKRHQAYFGFKEEVHPHDLRRTYRSVASDVGVPWHVAEKLLNHSIGKMEKIYDRSEMWDERVKAMGKIESYYFSLLSQDKVVLFDEAKRA